MRRHHNRSLLNDGLLLMALALAGLTAAMSSGPGPRREVSELIEAVRVPLSVGAAAADDEAPAVLVRAILADTK